MKFQIQMEGEFVKCAMFWRNIKFDLEGQIYVGLRWLGSVSKNNSWSLRSEDPLLGMEWEDDEVLVLKRLRHY